MRRKLSDELPGSVIIRQAERDAYALLDLRYVGVMPTRDRCAGLGITARRWQWAVALLRYGGVYGVCRRYTMRTRTIVQYDVMDGLTLDAARGMVEARIVRLLDDPDGLDKLRRWNGRYPADDTGVSPAAQNDTLSAGG